MESRLKIIADSFGKNRVKFFEPISGHSSLNIGGPASLFIMAHTVTELTRIVLMCRELNVPLMVFGTGSKMLISDQGFKGVVIKNATRNIKVVSLKGKVAREIIGVDYAFIEVDGGVTIKGLIEFLDKHGLSSEEFKNIPGSLGGNIFLNRFLQSKAEDAKVLTLEGKVEKTAVTRLRLGRHIILSATLKIKSKN